MVAKKTREALKLHYEMEGKECYPVEEIKFIPSENEDDTEEQRVLEAKRKKRRRDMARYAPLIFEECYVKHNGLNRVANTFEMDQDPELALKIDPCRDHSQKQN
jgi:hypothetical protein